MILLGESADWSGALQGNKLLLRYLQLTSKYLQQRSGYLYMLYVGREYFSLDNPALMKVEDALIDTMKTTLVSKTNCLLKLTVLLAVPNSRMLISVEY